MKILESKHCKLCENLDFHISYGSKCSLTEKKPSFGTKCSKIKFDNTLERYIEEINVEKYLVDKTKFDSVGTFILYLIISLGFMIGSILLGKYILEKGYISTVTIIIFGAGLTLLPKAFGTLNHYLQKRRVINERINELDELLKLYGKEYEIKLSVQEIHGTIEKHSKIILKNIPIN